MKKNRFLIVLIIVLIFVSGYMLGMFGQWLRDNAKQVKTHTVYEFSLQK